jgi:hypothetical protein
VLDRTGIVVEECGRSNWNEDVLGENGQGGGEGYACVEGRKSGSHGGDTSGVGGVKEGLGIISIRVRRGKRIIGWAIWFDWVSRSSPIRAGRGGKVKSKEEQDR